MMLGWYKKKSAQGKLDFVTRFVVVFGCITVAVLAGWGSGTPASPGLVVGSFIGAALSLVVNYVVNEFEGRHSQEIPKPFQVAARDSVKQAGYYREEQTILFSVYEDQTSKSEMI